MPLIDLWRVKDGKLIEHWEEFNLLEGIPADQRDDG
jgi:predicted SnoaL-like aldol condensation-catalyzing enzyme